MFRKDNLWAFGSCSRKCSIGKSRVERDELEHPAMLSVRSFTAAVKQRPSCAKDALSKVFQDKSTSSSK